MEPREAGGTAPTVPGEQGELARLPRGAEGGSPAVPPPLQCWCWCRGQPWGRGEVAGGSPVWPPGHPVPGQPLARPSWNVPVRAGEDWS